MISYEYIAGFLDGEGSIVLYKTGAYKNVQLNVSFSNTNLEVLHRIMQVTGGSIVKSNKSKNNWKQGYMLVITGKDKLLPLLERLQKLLIIKQEQCSLALRYLQTVKEDRKPLTADEKIIRNVMFDHMQFLNRRGDENASVAC